MTTIASAVLAGVGVLLAGSLPWVAVLAPLNLRFAPMVPWAAVPMAIYLWLYWEYVGGRIGSRETAETRRLSLRANPLPSTVWGLALATGLAGFAALLAGLTMMARLAPMPASAALETPAGMPAPTAFLLLVMASIVAGVTEEAGFRGYMQGPIERRYGLAMGLLVNGVMFGVLHFPNHPRSIPPAKARTLNGYLAGSIFSGRLWTRRRNGEPAPRLDAGFLRRVFIGWLGDPPRPQTRPHVVLLRRACPNDSLRRCSGALPNSRARADEPGRGHAGVVADSRPMGLRMAMGDSAQQASQPHQRSVSATTTTDGCSTFCIVSAARVRQCRQNTGNLERGQMSWLLHGMRPVRTRPVLSGIAIGFVIGILSAAAAAGLRSREPALPAAGILDGWIVVRDDETLLCESPAIFVAARQIECP
jgi:membrane protease YdiL (CAAX protease family)